MLHWSCRKENRRRLLEGINRRIKPGTRIFSDEWAGYRNLLDFLPENDYDDHKLVNHSENFVDVLDKDTHAQNIEAFWSVLSVNFVKMDLKRALL